MIEVGGRGEGRQVGVLKKMCERMKCGQMEMNVERSGSGA